MPKADQRGFEEGLLLNPLLQVAVFPLRTERTLGMPHRGETATRPSCGESGGPRSPLWP